MLPRGCLSSSPPVVVDDEKTIVEAPPTQPLFLTSPYYSQNLQNVNNKQATGDNNGRKSYY